jgi:plasmid stabilization system protein ParE
MRVRYTVNALRHLTAIAAYIGERNATAAPRARERIEAAANRLGSFPHMSRKGAAPGTREWKVTGLPYVIVHEVRPEADEVVILGVFHEARLRPGQAKPSDRE